MQYCSVAGERVNEIIRSAAKLVCGCKALDDIISPGLLCRHLIGKPSLLLWDKTIATPPHTLSLISVLTIYLSTLI